MKAKGNIFFSDILKKHEFKITPQRLAIMEILYGNKTHPTADKVFGEMKKIMPNISFNTVYTTLNKFAEKKIINAIGGNGTARRFDPDTKEHGHFICIKCGSIDDFTYNAGLKSLIPGEILKKTLSKRIVAEGLCKKCSGKS